MNLIKKSLLLFLNIASCIIFIASGIWTLGNYLAAAIDDLSIYNSKEEAEFLVGVHAGLTEDEMIIPLIVKEK